MIHSIPGKSLLEKKETILNTKFLDDLRISFEQAKSILERNGYEFVLDESDKHFMDGKTEGRKTGSIALRIVCQVIIIY